MKASARIKESNANTCDAKTPYLTQDEANRIAHYVRKRGKIVKTYRCSHCACWHLTSQ
jgi:hypothetical protein